MDTKTDKKEKRHRDRQTEIKRIVRQNEKQLDRERESGSKF